MKITNSHMLIITLLLVLLSVGTASASSVRLENTVPTQIKVRNASLNIEDVFNASFDARIEQFMNEGHIPSLAASVIYKDKMIWAKGYGEQSDIDTVYYIYSITKTLTATAVLQLHEKGLIDLDDDVNDTLPFNLRNPNYPDIPITYRLLLSHRASIAEGWFNLIEVSGILSFPDFIKEMLVPSGTYYNPNNWHPRQPGTYFTYSNLDYALLSYLVELISNQTIGDYFSDNILDPLNMSNTRWKPSEYENESCLAIQHEYMSGNNIEQPHEELNVPGAGGLRSTVSDLSHFLIAHMNGGMYNNVSILTNSSVELMHNNEDDGDDYGSGWTTDIDGEMSHLYPNIPASECGTNLQGHCGGGPGYPYKIMAFDSSSEIGLILLQNQGFQNVPHPQINVFTLAGFILETAGVPRVTTTTSVHHEPEETTTTTPGFEFSVLWGIITLLLFVKKKGFYKMK